VRNYVLCSDEIKKRKIFLDFSLVVLWVIVKLPVSKHHFMRECGTKILHIFNLDTPEVSCELHAPFTLLLGKEHLVVKRSIPAPVRNQAW
jgi:hypothetical protein